MRPVHKKMLLIGMPVLVLIATFTAIVSSQRGKAESASPRTKHDMVATIATLHRQATAMTEEIPGTIAAIQHADIAPKVMSRVAAMYVREGDHVLQGQLLARLEDKDLAASGQAGRASSGSIGEHGQVRLGNRQGASQPGL